LEPAGSPDALRGYGTNHPKPTPPTCALNRNADDQISIVGQDWSQERRNDTSGSTQVCVHEQIHVSVGEFFDPSLERCAFPEVAFEPNHNVGTAFGLICGVVIGTVVDHNNCIDLARLPQRPQGRADRLAAVEGWNYRNNVQVCFLKFHLRLGTKVLAFAAVP
jgi:hypothetical protein